MTRPIVGIISNTAIINDQYEVDGSGKMNAEAISDASGAIPLIFPANPRLLSVNELLETCDGFLLTGDDLMYTQRNMVNWKRLRMEILIDIETL